MRCEIKLQRGQRKHKSAVQALKVGGAIHKMHQHSFPIFWHPLPTLFNVRNFWSSLIPQENLSIRMSHWHHMMVDGAEFWITCKRLKLLRKAGRLQSIQNSAPSTIRWRQCDIRIGTVAHWSWTLWYSRKIFEQFLDDFWGDFFWMIIWAIFLQFFFLTLFWHFFLQFSLTILWPIIWTIFWPIIWTIFWTFFKGVLKHWASILFTSICWRN